MAETATARAAAEDLDAHALVHGLGDGDRRGLGIWPVIEVHQGVLGHAPRHVFAVGRNATNAAVFEVVDVVELGHIDAAGAREAQQDLVATSALGLGLANDRGDVEHCLFAVAEHCGVNEHRQGLGVEGCVAAGDHDRVCVGAVDCVQRNAREIEGGQHVGVAKLGGERDAHEVELTDGSVVFDAELRHAVLAHQRLEVGPHRIGALAQDICLLVEDFVQDRDTLVRRADLVGVGVHQCPADVHGVPVFDNRVDLAADVLHRLADERQQLLEAREHRAGVRSHGTRVGRGCRHKGKDTRDEAPRSPTSPSAPRPHHFPRRCPVVAVEIGSLPGCGNFRNPNSCHNRATREIEVP